jgi:hypothetical protein
MNTHSWLMLGAGVLIGWLVVPYAMAMVSGMGGKK